MPAPTQAPVSVEELAMLIGTKDIEIFLLQKQIHVMAAELAKLKASSQDGQEHQPR